MTSPAGLLISSSRTLFQISEEKKKNPTDCYHLFPSAVVTLDVKNLTDATHTRSTGWPKLLLRKYIFFKLGNFCKDTGFNVGTDNVTIDVKVDSDELSLMKKKTKRKLCKNGPGDKRGTENSKKQTNKQRTKRAASICLTNREELSFLTVLAFPKASRMGLAWSSCFSSSPWWTQREKNNTKYKDNLQWVNTAVTPG